MRGGLWTGTGCQVYNDQRHYAPLYLPDGVVEQDPQTWLTALIELTQGAVQFARVESDQIEAVSITAQRSSVIPVDSGGIALSNCMMWQDRRGQDICDRLTPYAATIYQKCGARPTTVFLGPKISWFQEKRPDIYRRAAKFVAIPDLLIAFITGRFVTDTTYASRSLLMNLRSLTWDEELLRLLNIDKAKLSEIVAPGSIVGNSCASFRTLTELKSGTPVISAGGDQQCAALGAGTLEEGRIQINTGTGSFVIASSDSLRLHPDMAVTCGCSAIPGKFVLEASILTTAAIYRWFKQEFYRKDGYEEINHDAGSSPIGANGLVLLPHFQGRGSPDWNSRSGGTFFNLNLGTTRGDMARAILEGIAAEIAENIEILDKLIERTCEITAAGGLTKASIFNQIQADMYGRNVNLGINSEASLFGAWISAAVGVGLYPDYKSAKEASTHGEITPVVAPIFANTAKYQELRGLQVALYKALCTVG